MSIFWDLIFQLAKMFWLKLSWVHFLNLHFRNHYEKKPLNISKTVFIDLSKFYATHRNSEILPKSPVPNAQSFYVFVYQIPPVTLTWLPRSLASVCWDAPAPPNKVFSYINRSLLYVIIFTGNLLQVRIVSSVMLQQFILENYSPRHVFNYQTKESPGAIFVDSR
jgi:hypothetical protein